MTFSAFFRDYGSLLVLAIQVLSAGIAWWFGRVVATKRDVSDLAARVVELERAAAQAPTEDDITALRLEMSRHSGQMQEFSALLNGARETITAKVEGLDRVVERAERMLDTLTRHLLETNR